MTLVVNTLVIQLIAVAIAVYGLAYKALQERRRRSLVRMYGCLPVTRLDQKDPLLGLDMLKGDFDAFKSKTFLRTLQEKHAEHGTTWAYRTMGRLTVNSIEPENFNAVLSKSNDCFELGRNRMDAVEPGIEHGLLTVDGSMWRNARKLTQPGFNPRILHRVPYEKLVQKLLDKLPSDRSTPVDLHQLFGRFTIDATSELVFGHSLDVQALPDGSKEASEIEAAFEGVLKRVEDLLTRGIAALWFPGKGHRAGLQRITDYIDSEIKTALAKSTDEKTSASQCMVDLLSLQTREKTVIRGQLSHIVIAGRDTTASLLSHLFFELASHPEVWSKLRDEVATLKGQPPELSELARFPYLRACLDEALRMYPAAPFINRRATSDVVLPRGGGADGQAPMLLRKGEEITFQLYVMHRREEYFGPNTEDFVPERWEYIKPGHAFSPFGGGRRMCIGRQFAYEETSYVTIRMVQHFSTISRVGNEPWVEALSALLANGRGTEVVLEPSTPAQTITATSEATV